MGGPLGDMPVRSMGPPVLVHRKAKVALAEMPAIVLYLGERLGLMPAGRPVGSAKIVNDANDAFDEIILVGGRQMWADARRRQFVSRLTK